MELRSRVGLSVRTVFRNLCLFRGAIEETFISRRECSNTIGFFISGLMKVEQELQSNQSKSFCICLLLARDQWRHYIARLLEGWSDFADAEDLARARVILHAPFQAAPELSVRC